MNKNSSQFDNSEQPTSKMGGSKPATGLWETSEMPYSGKATSAEMQEPKITPKSSSVEEP